MLQLKNFGFLQNSNQYLSLLQNKDLNYQKYIQFILFFVLKSLFRDFSSHKLLQKDQSWKRYPNLVYLLN